MTPEPPRQNRYGRWLFGLVAFAVALTLWMAWQLGKAAPEAPDLKLPALRPLSGSPPDPQPPPPPTASPRPG